MNLTLDFADPKEGDQKTDGGVLKTIRRVYNDRLIVEFYEGPELKTRLIGHDVWAAYQEVK